MGVSYYLGTRIGFALTPVGQPNSTFWPPNAILLATFLLAPPRTWWTFLLAALPAHLLAHLQTGIPLSTAVGWFITNTAEALVGAFCITRLTEKENLFHSVRGVFIFLAFGVFIAPLTTSFMDAAAVVITGWGREYWPLGAERFWTNALAELTIVPTIVICSSNHISRIGQTTFARLCEAALLALGTVMVMTTIFGLRPLSPGTAPALLYVLLPLSLWAAVRFGIGGLSLSLLCVALTSMWFTMHGRAPFPHATLAQNVLSLQILLCLVMVPLMFLSAVLSEFRLAQDSLRSISSRLISAQEQERHRIARELHDDLGQSLALVHASLKGLIEESNEMIKPRLVDLCNQLTDVATAAHEISHDLYPSQLEYLGLEAALRKLCNDTMLGRDLRITLTISNLPSRLHPSILLCLFRVVQEALHNVVTHSQATRVEIELRADATQAMLRVVDNGVGFDRRHTLGGLGLSSMQERIRSVRGSIKIKSAPGKGTQIKMRVPILEDRATDFLDVA